MQKARQHFARLEVFAGDIARNCAVALVRTVQCIQLFHRFLGIGERENAAIALEPPCKASVLHHDGPAAGEIRRTPFAEPSLKPQ